MEVVQATINYYIREQFWCSIRNLCDTVSRLLTRRSSKEGRILF